MLAVPVVDRLPFVHAARTLLYAPQWDTPPLQTLSGPPAHLGHPQSAHTGGRRLFERGTSRAGGRDVSAKNCVYRGKAKGLTLWPNV